MFIKKKYLVGLILIIFLCLGGYRFFNEHTHNYNSNIRYNYDCYDNSSSGNSFKEHHNGCY